MKLIRPSNTRSLEERLRTASSLQLTYSEPGTALLGAPHSGYEQHRYEIELRSGDGVFDRAVAGLRTWKAHKISGVAVFPSSQPVVVGASVILVLGPPFLAIAAPCRIVQVIENSTQYGFTYGTLPGHPEGGEEAFVVSQSLNGKIQFEITGFSRPESTIVRLSGPIARSIQSRATRAYLSALKSFAEA